VALAARLAVVAWASGRFPPAGDGVYYDTIARRIAAGHGYTWLWPDGAVTYAAHYPVGYPALVGAAFSVFGSRVAVAMVLNAVLGALGAGAAHRIALRAMPAKNALWGGLVVALHPALVPYTAALMTEGVTSALLLIAVAFAAATRDGERPWSSLVLSGVTMGAATLVRPQCLALAPILGLLAAPGRPGSALRSRVAAAGVALGLAVLVCLPWTARNCVRMQRCALVSVNGGWNLLIGAETATGGWAEVVVPTECREVWGEAAKDTCFELAARRRIAENVGAWLAKAPAKVAQTFDYIGAAPWYLHASNPSAFDDGAKLALGAGETVVTRLLLALALVGIARRGETHAKARWAVVAVGLVFTVLVHAWVGYVALAVAVVLRGLRAWLEGPLLVSWTAALIAVTALTHAAFFGAGRYGLVVLPFVALLAASLGAPAPPAENNN
jgi:hypothetical protein